MPFESPASPIPAARQGARQALELICKCEHPERGRKRGHSLAGACRGRLREAGARSSPPPSLCPDWLQGPRQPFLLPHAGSHHLINCQHFTNKSQINLCRSQREWPDWTLSRALSLEAERPEQPSLPSWLLFLVGTSVIMSPTM